MLLNTYFSRLLAWAKQTQGCSALRYSRKLRSHYSMCFKWSVLCSNLLSGFLPGLFIAISTCCRNRVLVYVGGMV